MGRFNLETRVCREHTGNLKDLLTPSELKENGLESYNAAEMDFETAPAVIESIKKLADNGLFGFTLCDEEYKNAVCWWMKKVRRETIEPEWIQTTLGTIFSLATCIRMCCGTGDNIIVQPPVYNRYKQAADRIGVGTVFNPLIVDENGRYKMDLIDLEQKMSDPANKLLVVCNPNNPTGTCWPEETLEKVAEFAVKYDVIVYSDEIFADYTFEDHTSPMFTVINKGKNNGVSATSLGKTFSLTGLNHANIIISDPVLRCRFEKQKYSDHYGSLDPVSRAALLGGYSEEGLQWKNEVHDLIWDNYCSVCEFFAENLPEVVISPLNGSYVMWLDWRKLNIPFAEIKEIVYGKAMMLLEDGDDFCINEEGFTRMNIATPSSEVSSALERLKTVIADLRRNVI